VAIHSELAAASEEVEEEEEEEAAAAEFDYEEEEQGVASNEVAQLVVKLWLCTEAWLEGVIRDVSEVTAGHLILYDGERVCPQCNLMAGRRIPPEAVGRCTGCTRAPMARRLHVLFQRLTLRGHLGPRPLLRHVDPLRNIGTTDVILIAADLKLMTAEFDYEEEEQGVASNEVAQFVVKLMYTEEGVGTEGVGTQAWMHAHWRGHDDEDAHVANHSELAGSWDPRKHRVSRVALLHDGTRLGGALASDDLVGLGLGYGCRCHHPHCPRH
jgi:hypothetical protein